MIEFKQLIMGEFGKFLLSFSSTAITVLIILVQQAHLNSNLRF
jgi:hypothetical protein